MGRDRVVVNGHSAGWLKKGFPWVYPKELVRGGGRRGQEITLVSNQGQVLGRGLADDGWLAARVYRFDDAPLDEAWLHETLDRAAALREIVIPEDTDAYRLVHGENDGLPGVRLDWWGHFAVLILDTPAAAPLIEGVLSWLESRRSPRGVYLCYRPDSRDRRRSEDWSPAPGLLAGRAAPGDVRVRERGVRFDVRPHEGPDVGLYCDMREVRAWLEPCWGGMSVLNTFAYTGAFSVAAAFHGATEVVSVDLSARYLDRAEQNFAANSLDPAPHEFVVDDTFKALDRFRRQGRLFDRVVLDPPSFSHSSEGTWSAQRDYPRLVAAAARVTAPGGWVVAASNQGELSPHQFTGLVGKGLSKAKRSAQLLHFAGAASDFPAAVRFPEGRYLKVGVYRLDG